MPDKPADLFSRLPSVSEILDAPQVRAVIDRVSRTAVATSVRTYLEQVRSDLQHRFGDTSQLTPEALAERLAQYLLSKHGHPRQSAINATGCFTSAHWLTVPLAEEARLAMLHAASNFSLQEDCLASPAESTGLGEVGELLCRQCGADAALAVNSYSAAVWLTLAAVGEGRNVLVARSQYGDLEGMALPDLIQASGAQLKGVGATNRVDREDYRRALDDTTAAVLHVHWDNYYVGGENRSVQVEELAGLCEENSIPLIKAMDGAALGSERELASRENGESASAGLAAGAGIVILRGSGMVGGPPCGLILGRSDLIDQLLLHPLLGVMRIDEYRRTALVETLRLGDQAAGHTLPAVPIQKMALTSVENLRHRAERLAPQLVDDYYVRSAAPMSLEASIDKSDTSGAKRPSFGVALIAGDAGLDALEQRLLTAVHPVVCRREADRLLLDLRTVLPEQDTQIAEAVSGSTRDRREDAPAEAENVSVPLPREEPSEGL